MSDFSHTIEWDHEIIERYNSRGPRYTSYPTALAFNQAVTETDYRAALTAIPSNELLSLYVHIPFCFNICYYCGCNKQVTRDYRKATQYLEALGKEIDHVADQLEDPSVVSMHWGGGTPTYLNIRDRQWLMTKLTQAFKIKPEQLDASIEVDPRTVTPSDIAQLKSMGFNRVSLGVQDFDPKVQQAINREQSYESVKELVDAARVSGYRSISFDLIYGLPHQSVESYRETLALVAELRPDRISVFNYAHLPHRFKAQRKILKRHLPEPEEKLEILKLCIEFLQQQGYVYIGMDHFALPEDELSIAQEQGQLLRNFQGYATGKHTQLIGLGVSSISSVGEYYVQNEKGLSSYYDAIEREALPVWRGVKLDEDDELRRHIIFQLMCYFNLSVKDIEKTFNISFWNYFNHIVPRLEIFQRDGLVKYTPSTIEVLPKGRLLIRNIAMLFDKSMEELIDIQSFSNAI
ncbi:oxygen-independent coproporphyrinogen III oxidase [Pleionea sp. CnH1-48]|uniref:oxygen-independent coproporphyrinogen III oxidase n=1 Tax=Pleionea sp. CnH1-48 TaxID=2954494 RepID=UPI0020973387|nr:oxygen-independent coproporphyrinogen III oxidase [Pleionea sp. CnH1-48]MCO7223949.1 oxygen-independent coproporphyrinogen III oxidase [Pleionea sp. CnH1-48]